MQPVPTTIAQFYPEDALANATGLDAIDMHDAHTLDELFRARVRRSPDKTAYAQYDNAAADWLGVTWAEMASRVERWQVAFRETGLVKGDRVAICYRNSIEWVVFDQAALRLGLVVVPLYTADRAQNMAFVLADSRAKLVLFESSQAWVEAVAGDEDLGGVDTVLVFAENEVPDPRIALVSEWLPEHGQHLDRGVVAPADLATIVYTSGTTGRPKGVMLSHKNILSNAFSGMRSVALNPDDQLLSFLPLSHTLERTVGYYAAMLCGAGVSFNRSIAELPDDLLQVRPTVLVSVPRIFERVHNQIYRAMESANPVKRSLFKRAVKTGWHRFQYQQGQASWHPRLLLASLLDQLVAKPVRQKLGGNLEFAVVGGAPLSLEVSRTFISLGITLLQGYGLTEASPVVSVNTKTHNRPDTIGLPLRGVKVKLMDNDELCVSGENVMLGYWGRPEATSDVMAGEWLRTGDRATIDDAGFIRIIGRIKDILVLANGEKVAPPDIEAAVVRDSLFEQVMVVGEGRPYLSVLVVVDRSQWQQLCNRHQLNPAELNSPAVHQTLLQRIDAQMGDFPGYARLRGIYVSDNEWTIASGLLTPTLKLKRAEVVAHFQQQIEELYQGHGVYLGQD